MTIKQLENWFIAFIVEETFYLHFIIWKVDFFYWKVQKKEAVTLLSKQGIFRTP